MQFHIVRDELLREEAHGLPSRRETKAGVEGPTENDTSARATEAFTVEPEPTALPVVFPLRKTTGKTLPATKAITLIR
jgi:hypothetical protein